MRIVISSIIELKHTTIKRGIELGLIERLIEKDDWKIHEFLFMGIIFVWFIFSMGLLLILSLMMPTKDISQCEENEDPRRYNYSIAKGEGG